MPESSALDSRSRPSRASVAPTAREPDVDNSAHHPLPGDSGEIDWDNIQSDHEDDMDVATLAAESPPEIAPKPSADLLAMEEEESQKQKDHARAKEVERAQPRNGSGDGQRWTKEQGIHDDQSGRRHDASSSRDAVHRHRHDVEPDPDLTPRGQTVEPVPTRDTKLLQNDSSGQTQNESGREPGPSARQIERYGDLEPREPVDEPKDSRYLQSDGRANGHRSSDRRPDEYIQRKSNKSKDLANNKKIRCELCGITVTGQVVYDSHIRGKQHKQKERQKNLNDEISFMRQRTENAAKQSYVSPASQRVAPSSVPNGRSSAQAEANVSRSREETTVKPMGASASQREGESTASRADKSLKPAAERASDFIGSPNTEAGLRSPYASAPSPKLKKPNRGNAVNKESDRSSLQGAEADPGAHHRVPSVGTPVRRGSSSHSLPEEARVTRTINLTESKNNGSNGEAAGRPGFASDRHNSDTGGSATESGKGRRSAIENMNSKATTGQRAPAHEGLTADASKTATQTNRHLNETGQISRVGALRLRSQVAPRPPDDTVSGGGKRWRVQGNYGNGTRLHEAGQDARESFSPRSSQKANDSIRYESSRDDSHRRKLLSLSEREPSDGGQFKRRQQTSSNSTREQADGPHARVNGRHIPPAVNPEKIDTGDNARNAVKGGRDGPASQVQRIPPSWLGETLSIAEWRELRHKVFKEGSDVDKLAYKLLQEIILSPVIGVSFDALKPISDGLLSAIEYQPYSNPVRVKYSDFPEALRDRSEGPNPEDDKKDARLDPKERALTLLKDNIAYAFNPGEGQGETRGTRGDSLPVRGSYGVKGQRKGPGSMTPGESSRYRDAVIDDELFNRILRYISGGR